MTKSEAKSVTVTKPVISELNAGQRLDNFLFTYLKGVPKSHIYRLIRRGEVRVNKGRASASLKLKIDDVVRVPVREHAPRSAPELPMGDDEAADLHRRVLLEDERFLVINKAVGEVVHAGSRHRHGLVDRIKLLYEDENLFLLHRLDRGTTGCLLFAKSRAVMLAAHKAFVQRDIKKVYLVLVAGRWRANDKRVVSEDTRGRHAETTFRIKRALGEYTLLEARPLTGRTHQIRMHVAERGCPTVGDRKYGRRDARLQPRRLFLHAWKLSFTLDGHQYRLTAPTDELWDNLIASLKSG